MINFFESEASTSAAHQAFKIVQEMGVNSYPTLILQKGDELIKIGGDVMSAEKLEENLQNVQKLKGSN